MTKTTVIHIRLEQELYDWFKSYCAELEPARKMSDVLRSAIQTRKINQEGTEQ